VEPIEAWSNMHESLRKCIECAFGILKQRFRIFKRGVDIRSFSELDDTWFTCVALHNILLSRPDEYEYSTAIGSTAARTAAAVPFPIDRLSISHNKLRCQLIEHFWYQFKQREVKWPSKSGSGSNNKIKKFSFDLEEDVYVNRNGNVVEFDLY
jgi:hypothetical protein